MTRIALAGGIGAGKSTVVDYLRSLGYLAIDADEVARQVTAPGQPVLAAVVDAFGTAVLTDDGELDRSFLATIVFSDESARSRINAITHGPIGVEVARQLDEAGARVSFVAIPLLRAEHRTQLDLDEVWSIQVAPEVALDRLVEQRGMSVEAAQARLGAQIGNDERETLADEVIWNNGDRGALLSRIDELLLEKDLRGD